MNRRSFIASVLAGIALPVTPPALAAASRSTGRRLILVELSGANDGLNTIVPIHDERYRQLRPELALSQRGVFDSGTVLAFHTALTALDSGWQNGEVAIVQGLGSPDQTRSHFQSIAQWETGGGDTGWLTEGLSSLSASVDDALGISIDGGMGPFRSEAGRWISLTSLHQLQAARTQDVLAAQTPAQSTNPALSLLMDRSAVLDQTITSISDKLDRFQGNAIDSIDAGDLGRQATIAAHLIRAGIDAPVIKLKIDGFDTHEHQLWRHADRLGELGAALAGLRRILMASGHWRDTLVMTYSEFGRRATENGSGGTDHGSAAPHFVMGGSVNGGLYGQSPDLGRLIDNDVPYSLDYRALYDRVLAAWFGQSENRFRSFRSTDLDGLIAA